MDDIGRAAEALRGATALVIGAGAGMGVDSGLPDFRGPQGFWRAYPPYERLGLGFQDLASPHWFREDPALAWGFYGHRLHLYRATRPHAGFDVLLRHARRAEDGGFVFTSNVDGQFQAAGFGEDQVAECHGSLAALQCLAECGAPLFPSAGVTVDVDPATFRARPPLPSCPRCGGLARPNVLMFGDGGWDESRTYGQRRRQDTWLRRAMGRPHARVAVVECGAGTDIPTVRMFCEGLAGLGATLVRINPREPEVPPGHVGLALGACAALEQIEAAQA